MLHSRITIKRACRSVEDSLFTVPFDEVLETVRYKFTPAYFRKIGYKNGANNESFTGDIKAVLNTYMHKGADARAASLSIVIGLLARDLADSVATAAIERRRREARAGKDTKTTGIMTHPVRIVNKKGATVTKNFSTVTPEYLSRVYSRTRRAALTHIQSNSEVWGRYAEVNRVATSKDSVEFKTLQTVSGDSEAAIAEGKEVSSASMSRNKKAGEKVPGVNMMTRKNIKTPVVSNKPATMKKPKPTSNPKHGFSISSRKRRTNRRK